MTDSPSLSGTPVLVTGATGFIGSRLAERLATREGAVVMGLGRDLTRVAGLRDQGIELVQMDLRAPSDLEEVLAGTEVAFHVAGTADAETARGVNVEATDDLVRSAARADVRRLVHVSTVAVYDMEGRQVADEAAPRATGHPSSYPRTKAQGEKRVFEVAAGTDLTVTAVRPSMVYGPGPGLWTVEMVRSIQQGEPVFLGDGSAHFHPVYLDDVVRALVRCATAPEAAGEAFNVTAGTTPWKDFMGRYGTLCGTEPKGLPVWLARLMCAANWIPGVSTPIDRAFLEVATSRWRFPNDKARERLGWAPQVDLEEGMERTARWLTEEGPLSS